MTKQIRFPRTKRFVLLLAVCALAFAAGTGAVYAQATGFDLSWWTVDGGGGNSTGSGYALSGTIGQPDAGTLSGGDYQLQGGVWGGGAASVIEQNKLFLPLVRR